MHGDLGRRLGVTWPSGLLLHGPPGTGKSLAVHAVADECGARVRTVTPSSVLGAFVGESERRLREIFDEVLRDVEEGADVVLFFDEVDALCPRRDRGGPQEARLVAQLITLLDTAVATTRARSSKIPADTERVRGVLLMVGATNNPNAIDAALRRPGRLEREVHVGMPDLADRIAIFRTQLGRVCLAAGVDLEALASLCSGYTGADIAVLCREAALFAMECVDDDDAIALALSDFERARSKVRPTVSRSLVSPSEGAGGVSWDDICGLEGVKHKLRQLVHWPLQHAEAFARLGLEAFRGALLYGPPGCCKTRLCRAAASTADLPLVGLSCAEVLSMYVGESEERLRSAFKKARLAAPCVLFFDELDAFCGRRKGASASHSGRGDKLLATFLTEMDGLDERGGVFVLAATNRPEEIDDALLRPGRFDGLLYVPPPTEEERVLLLKHYTEGMALDASVDLEAIAKETAHYTGAEVEGLCREAFLGAASGGEAEGEGPVAVTGENFEEALLCTRPLLSEEEVMRLQKFRS